MNLPTTEPAKRVSELFHRQLSTAWNLREIRVFKALVKAGCFKTMDDLALIERYYAAERKKGDRGVHRRDLSTLLNNWQSELDRARAWAAQQPGAGYRRVKEIMRPPELTDEQIAKNKAVIAPLIENLRRQFHYT